MTLDRNENGGIEWILLPFTLIEVAFQVGLWLACIGVPFASLYVLVRFVKWAWQG